MWPVIDKTTEYTFDKAYIELLDKNMIITSKSSGYSYKSEHLRRFYKKIR